MLFKNIAVMRADGTVSENCTVGVDDSHISFVCENVTAVPDGNPGRVVDGTGRLLMPGMVNAHTHAAMTLLRGYGEDMPLERWLFDRIFPFEDRLCGEDIYWGSMLAMAEMLAAGTTSITDMYFFPHDIARAVGDSGIKASIGRPFSCFDPTLKLADLPAYADLTELAGNMQGAFDGRLKIDTSIHAEYTSFPSIIAEAAELADKLGTRMHVHLSETAKEHRECIGRWGKTPTRVLLDAGMLERPVTVAHGVWLTDDDIEILAAHDVTVAHCPQSNLKLACGIARVPHLRERGVRVALGTDSAASNNNLDLLEEGRAAALLAKGISLDPTALPAGEVVGMLTRAGALSQGRDDCGDILPGYRADFAVLDMTLLNMTPCHDMAANVLYSSGHGDVVMTVVDGKIVYENGEFPTIDVERVKHEVAVRAARCAGKV